MKWDVLIPALSIGTNCAASPRPVPYLSLSCSKGMTEEIPSGKSSVGPGSEMSDRPQRDLLPGQEDLHIPISKGNNYVHQDLPVALVCLMKMLVKTLLPRKVGALLAHLGVRMERVTISVVYGIEGAWGDTWV